MNSLTDNLSKTASETDSLLKDIKAKELDELIKSPTAPKSIFDSIPSASSTASDLSYMPGLSSSLFVQQQSNVK